MAKKPKPRRRLSKVKVDEVSLVGKPAVQGSRFLVAKREDETMSEEAAAVVEDVVATAMAGATEVEPVEKEEDVQPDGDVTKAEVPENFKKKPGKGKKKPADGEEEEEDGEEMEEDAAEKKPKGKEKKPVKKEGETIDISKSADAWLQAIRTLRASASDMDPPGLEMLANVIRYTGYRYGDEEKVRTALTKMDIELGEFDEAKDDVEKALRVIGPTNFGKIETAASSIVTQAQTIQGLVKTAREIKKQEDGDDGGVGDETDDATGSEAAELTKEGTQVAEPKTDRDPPQQTQKDLLSAVGDILQKRAEEVERQQNDALLTGLNKIAARLDDVEGRQIAFAEGLKKATGKV